MTSSSSTVQPLTRATRPDSSPWYRQVEYYDGKNICIAESHRRQHVTLTTPYSPLLVRNVTRLPDNTQPDMTKNGSHSASSSTMTFSSEASRPRSHVTCKSRRTRTKAVIVQADNSGKKLSGAWPISEYGINDIATPPKTPEIARLPTPDLEDISGQRFCDCCNEGKGLRCSARCMNSMGVIEC